MKSLSIIIPVYNTEKYLERCLESVSGLRYPVDVILIDDGSSDESGRICDRYAQTDRRYRAIHQENRGLIDARKRGILEVQTDYFAFVDSDDYIDAEAYDKMLNNVLHDNLVEADIICFGMMEEYMNRQYKKINDFEEGVYGSESINLIYKCMISKGYFFHFGILPNVVCKLFKTDFSRGNPASVNPVVRVGEDADLSYQMLLKASKVQVLHETPYHYDRRQDSMMWKKMPSESIDELEKDLKKAIESSVHDKGVLFAQLKDYMSFVRLLCAPKRIFEKDVFFKSKTDRIALYGAGGVGQAVKSELDNVFSVWVDRNYALYENNNIAPIETLYEKQNMYDKVFIAIADVEICKGIKETLIAGGIKKPIHYFRDKEA